MKNTQLTVSTIFLTVVCISSVSISKATAQIPEPECITTYSGDGATACGYDCEKSADGEKVACAEWPEGKCESGFHTVACGPDAPDGWHEKYEENAEDRDRECNCNCDR